MLPSFSGQPISSLNAAMAASAAKGTDNDQDTDAKEKQRRYTNFLSKAKKLGHTQELKKGEGRGFIA